MEYELHMYMIKFALTCKTLTSRSNSKTHSNRYKNNCLCVKKTLTINSQLGTAEVVDHIIKSTQQGNFLFHLDIVLNIF